MEQRNTLLASMTDEVGELVLNDNYRQNQAISLMESHERVAPGLLRPLHPHAGRRRACSTARSSSCRATPSSPSARRAARA